MARASRQAIGVATVLGMGLAVAAAIPAAQAATVTRQPSSLTLSHSELSGVSAVSPTDAWAVGHYDKRHYRTLILHWNGQAWAQAPSPSPSSGYNTLDGVSAVSASDAWAVGNFGKQDGADDTAMILHWNGTTWSQVKIPSMLHEQLSGVSAVSASDAWAVGEYGIESSTGAKTLILHWDGTSWSEVAAPDPSPSSTFTFNSLSSVSGVSATNAWADGSYETSTGAYDSLILHWNGKAWSQVKSPNPGTPNPLGGVSAVSGTNAWAVGSTESSDQTGEGTLTVRWNGKSWSQVASPSPGDPSESNLTAVSARSATDAWAVGGSVNQGSTTNPYVTLILHWNGTAWSQVASPNVGVTDFLNGVSADSATDAWAVGSADFGVLILHWNGTSWSST